MPVSLPIKEMSFKEKIQTMEMLWDDLCKDPEQFESPAWHLDELKHREQLINEGNAEYLDWDNVKLDIKKEL